MSQHDFNIANQGFPGFRADLNNALEALATLSSGATEPAAKFAYQHWVDTSTSPPTLKIRNGTNDGWISVTRLNSSTNVSTPVIVTQSTSDNSTNPASTAYVINRIANDAPTKTGIGASGNWGINITGSAASATTAGNGGVTAVNGQTGSITQTSVGSIGSYVAAIYAVNGAISVGETTSGSNLRYNFNPSNAFGDFNWYRVRLNNSTYDGGGTTLTGTWRCMARPDYTPEILADLSTRYNWHPGLFVRVL
jgi:hypothetical protein